MEYKDYYKILGVPRTATSDEIKSAFRKLAREHHPDVAKDKKAGEEKFKEINEAYEVLHEPEKRRKYDQLGADWQSGGGMGGGGRPGYGFPGGGTGGRGPDGMPEGWNSYDPDGEDVRFGGTGFSDFFESFFGQASAGGPGGMGGGARRGPATSSKGRDITADIMVSLEEALHKHTRRITLQRTAQRGQPPTVETYQVHIPPGVREGQMIRVAGQGERGRGPNAKPGDLFLRVRLEQHPLFRVEGMDLYYDVDLAPWEAVLGTSLQVKSLDGYLSLKIPPLAVSGQKLRLRGQGLPTKEGGRGDLFVILDIETPPKVTPEQKELWEKLAATSDFNPRATGV